MQTPEILRQQAAACRRAATTGRRPPHSYLIALAERYEQEAGALEQQLAGQKPGLSRTTADK